MAAGLPRWYAGPWSQQPLGPWKEWLPLAWDPRRGSRGGGAGLGDTVVVGCWGRFPSIFSAAPAGLWSPRCLAQVPRTFPQFRGMKTFSGAQAPTPVAQATLSPSPCLLASLVLLLLIFRSPCNPILKILLLPVSITSCTLVPQLPPCHSRGLRAPSSCVGAPLPSHSMCSWAVGD